MNPDISHLFIALAGLFVFFALLIFSASMVIRKPPVFRDIWLAYGQEFLIIGVVILPLILGNLFFLSVLLLLNLRAHYEIAGIQEKLFAEPGILASFITSSLVIAGTCMTADPDVAYLLAASVSLILFFLILVLHAAGMKDYVSLMSMVVMVLLSVISLVGLYRMEQGLYAVLFVYAITETNDTGGYLFGKLFGKRKLFPVLSSGKTAEGLLCGIFLSLSMGLLYNYLFIGEEFAIAILICLILIASSIIGDLVFSLYKRKYNRKDYPVVMAKQGGILDIYDSFLFASIIYYLVKIAGM